MSETTITRRRAIGATGTLFLGAGLLGATPTVAAQPAAAEPSPRSDLVAALSANIRQTDAEWSAWLDGWDEEYREMLDRLTAIQREIEALLPKERAFSLVDRLDTALGNLREHESEREREIVVRHMPGLEPVLRMLFGHALEMGSKEARACTQHRCNDQDW